MLRHKRCGRIAVSLTALLAVLVLAACASPPVGPDGRHYVEIRIVDRLWPATAPDGKIVGGRTTGPSTILLLRGNETNTRLVAHELAHTVQWRLHGAAFRTLYAKQLVTYGYQNMPLEVRAREAESDPWYLAWAEDLIATLPGPAE